MAKSRKNQRKMKARKGHKGRRHSGGGQGAGYEPGGALNPGLGNGLMVNRSYDACMTSSRPGQLSYAPSSGLPGMPGLSGMSGGAYTNNLETPIAGFAQIDKVGCTANHMNPLNQRGGVGSVGASDRGVYEAHSARYTTMPSQFTNSVGAPILLTKGLDGSAWSRSCSQTAGSRRRKHSGKKGKKTRAKKSRKTRRH